MGRRRRRLALAGGTAAVALVAVMVVTVGTGHSSRRPVRVEASNPPPDACVGGQTPSGTDARIGATVVYGWLPPGYHPISIGDFSGHINGAIDNPNVLVGPPSEVKPYDSAGIEAGYFIAPASDLDEDAGHPSTTVQGHPAVLYPGSVSWREEPDVEVTIDSLDQDLSQAALLHVADTVTFEPGVTAPSVGDLGPVTPRATAISAAETLATGLGLPTGHPTARTWLATVAELNASRLFAPPAADNKNPQWVILLTTQDNQTLVYVDAINGRAAGAISPGPTANFKTTDQRLAALVDHSTRQPCPDVQP